jgi:cytochrome b
MQQEFKFVTVWDPFVRLFHWSLVLAYLVAWVSAEEWAVVHEQSSYFILALIGLRVVWGLIGSRHARFSDFVYGPRRTLDYLKGLLSGRPQRYVGHNPAGGWMIVALLLALLGAIGSGMLVGDAEQDLWKELHEGLASLTLVLVFVHVGGVVLAGWVHGENLVKGMLTGKKLGRDGSA